MLTILDLYEKTGEELRQICAQKNVTYFPDAHKTALVYLLLEGKGPTAEEVEESNKWRGRDWNEIEFSEFPEHIKESLRGFKRWALENPDAFEQHKNECLRNDGEWSIWPAVIRTSHADHRPKLHNPLSMCEGVTTKDRIFRLVDIK